MNEELKAGVGLSRKWDAREAGREVALSTLEKLDGENPKFFLYSLLFIMKNMVVFRNS